MNKNIKKLGETYFEENWKELINEKNPQLDKKTRELLIKTVENEIKEIDALNNKDIKEYKLKELSRLVEMLFKSKDNKEKTTVLIKMIGDIVDNTLEGKMKIAIDLAIIEKWSIESGYEKTPFYLDGKKVKFHRAGFSSGAWLGFDTDVINDASGKNLLVEYMNEEYLQKINGGVKSESKSNGTPSSDDKKQSQQEAIPTPTSRPRTNEEILGMDKPKLFGTDKRIFDDFKSKMKNEQESHKLITKFIRELGKGKMVSKIKENNTTLLITSQDIENGLVKVLSGHYKSDMKSVSGTNALGRYRHFEEQWEKIFKEQGLPPLTSLLSYTESRVGQYKTSEVGAGGYFQFTPDSAKDWGLKINENVDERDDPIKSGTAAAKYIRWLWDDWYNYSIYTHAKDKIIETEKYEVKEKDRLTTLARKKGWSWKVLKEYNDIQGDELEVGQILLYPTKFDLSQINTENIKQDTFKLALASYNGGIGNRLKGKDGRYVKSYDEYLQTFSGIINKIKNYSEEIEFMNRGLNQSNLIDYTKRAITIYSNIQNEFMNQIFKDGEMIGFFNTKINNLKQILESKDSTQMKIKIFNENVFKNKENMSHLRYWYETILIQNLLYPANLYAVQNEYLQLKNSQNVKDAEQSYKDNMLGKGNLLANKGKVDKGGIGGGKYKGLNVVEPKPIGKKQSKT